MPAPRTATTARIGFQVVFSSERDPWYHGPNRFYGHVDHAYDFRKGYHGPIPPRGAPPVRNRIPFRGQAMHDPHGHEAPAGRR